MATSTTPSKHRSSAEIAAERQAKLLANLWDLLPDYVTLLADGTVNHDGTLEKFSDHLASFAEEHARTTAAIAETVEAVFDKYVGVNKPVDFFVNKVLTEMSVPPAQWSRTESKVRAYLDSQSEDASDGTFARMVVKRGRGGGIERRSDLVAAVAE